MKRLLTLLFGASSFAASAQSPIYNPDADGNGIITQADLLSFLSVFDTEYTGAPCNCGCYANPFYQSPPTGDTLSLYDIATNIFYGQPDSIQLDFVVAPYGTGSMPFSDVDTLFYDTLAFRQTYPFSVIRLAGGGAYGEPWLGFRDQGTDSWQVNSSVVHGGVDVVDHDTYAVRVEAKEVCPNLQNDEFWFLNNEAQYFQVEDGVYINVVEFPSPSVPSQSSAEFPQTWFINYPLNWVVITEIYNAE